MSCAEVLWLTGASTSAGTRSTFSSAAEDSSQGCACCTGQCGHLLLGKSQVWCGTCLYPHAEGSPEFTAQPKNWWGPVTTCHYKLLRKCIAVDGEMHHMYSGSRLFFFLIASKTCLFREHVSERRLGACKHSLLQNTWTAWVYGRWGKHVGVFLSFCLQQPVTRSIKVSFLLGRQQWGFLKPVKERLTNFTWGSPSVWNVCRPAIAQQHFLRFQG